MFKDYDTWLVITVAGGSIVGYFDLETDARQFAEKYALANAEAYYLARVMAVVEVKEKKTYEAKWSSR